MLHRLAIRTALTAAVTFALATAGFAQSKVAIINLQRAVLEAASIKKADAEMQAKYKPRDEEIKKLQSEIQELEKNLQSGKLTPVAAQDAQAAGQRKQRELQRKTQDLQDEVQRERDEILSKSSQQMQAIVQKLAEEKGIDIVIDISNTVYFKPALEITTESIAAYDKAYPVK